MVGAKGTVHSKSSGNSRLAASLVPSSPTKLKLATQVPPPLHEAQAPVCGASI